MRKRHHYRRRTSGSADLDMTTFLNLMVVLVPFLLITAVFSRIAIVELTLPSSSPGTTIDHPEFRVEVIVREGGLELTNGTVPIAAIPKVDGKYDLERLQQLVMSLKRDHPSANAASVLLEPHIVYDHLIQVMDVVRSAPLPESEATMVDDGPEARPEPQRPQRVALFTDISIGDAP